jgi:hypothetical protein
MSAPVNQIKWYENAAWDAPELNSPQPCIHGAGCVFTVKDADGKILPGCCRYVHPGEEGTGRRLFPARTLDDGRVQPACVRLTGAAHQFYERRGRKIPWQEWCRQQDIPFTPNKPGEKHEPVQKVPFGGKRPNKKADIRATTPTPGDAIHDISVPPGKSCAGCIATGATPTRPSPLNLSTPNARRERPRMITTSRSGECSPDCSCPSGFQCHDRSDLPMMRCNAISCEELETGLLSASSQIPTPAIFTGGAAAPQIPDEDDDGGATPRLSFDLEKAENIDYEEQD